MQKKTTMTPNSRFASIVIIITLTVLLLDMIINLLIWQQCQLKWEY